MEKLHVRNGIDNIEKYSRLFEGKRIGLVTNPSGSDRNLRPTVDIMNERYDLRALFSPEHGIMGSLQAGDAVTACVDGRMGLPVFSLYGTCKKPTSEMLDDTDVVVFDIQDIGSRFYTYIYTMSYVMEACAENGKTFVVLDRVNPVGGVAVEGNILEAGFESFVGLYPITIRHGMTTGEMAMFLNKECKIGCELEIVRIEGWNRSAFFEDTDLKWINPTPNMPSPETAILYNGTCLLEGTNVSEGRGTTRPFEMLGAPWIDPYELAEHMNGIAIPGIIFRPVCFVPMFSKYAGEQCGGVQLHITDRKAFRPVECGIYLLYCIMDMYPEKFSWLKQDTENGRYFVDLLAGTDVLRKRTMEASEIIEKWKGDSRRFNEIKAKYHLYPL